MAPAIVEPRGGDVFILSVAGRVGRLIEPQALVSVGAAAVAGLELTVYGPLRRPSAQRATRSNTGPPL